MSLLLRSADTAAVPTPVVHAVYNQFLAGAASGHGHLDWVGVARVCLEHAGLLDARLRQGGGAPRR